MEQATGRNGGRGRWGYREQNTTTWSSSSYTISSSSGTVSTGYTSTGGSHLYSLSLLAAAMHWDWELHGEDTEKNKEHKMNQAKSLVQEFFAAPPSVNCSGDMSVLERWLTELGVGWVLHLDDAASAGELERAFDAHNWIRALAEIVETISLFTPDRRSEGLPVICEEEAAVAQETNETSRGGGEQVTVEGEEADHQLRFAQFFQETMLKMLAFVDFIASEVVAVSNGVQEPYEKLSTLLGVRDALSKALPHISRLSSYPPPSPEVERIHGDMARLLSAEEGKAGEAVWSAVEEVRARILKPMEDSSGPETPQGSSDIDVATEAAISYIRFLRGNYSSLAPIVSAKHEPRIVAAPPLDSMIIEMASFLEKRLVDRSESFPDQSLRFLFLLNNSYYIWQQVQPIWAVIEFNATGVNRNFLSFMKLHVESTTRKFRSYMESYLEVSWTPVLSCLLNPTLLCLGKNYSPLAKFESEFQKTYTTQRQWKVPDPGLRKSLRNAIIKKIMPGYTKYIVDNNVSTPRVTPQELEEMLQELFEG